MKQTSFQYRPTSTCSPLNSLHELVHELAKNSLICSLPLWLSSILYWKYSPLSIARPHGSFHGSPNYFIYLGSIHLQQVDHIIPVHLSCVSLTSFCMSKSRTLKTFFLPFAHYHFSFHLLLYLYFRDILFVKYSSFIHFTCPHHFSTRSSTLFLSFVIWSTFFHIHWQK